MDQWSSAIESIKFEYTQKHTLQGDTLTSALIFGITGQDGLYLAEQLIENNSDS
jgi:hypothetical protein